MLKKMMLLAVAAAALVAFAVPASASAADMWTANGERLEAGEEAFQAYEGRLEFTTPPPAAPVHTTFGCDVTITIRAEGHSSGTVTTFAPTTSTCSGTGALAKCILKADKNNSAEGWEIDVSTTPATIKHKEAGKNLTIHTEYEGCASGAVTSHWELKSINVTITGTNPITKLTIAGTATNGFMTTTGSFTPEESLLDPDILGITTT